jgi:hypothetical protein
MSKVTVTVRNSLTKAGIFLATTRLMHQNTLIVQNTDVMGVATFENVPAGTWTVNVLPPYPYLEYSHDITVPASGDIQDIVEVSQPPPTPPSPLPNPPALPDLGSGEERLQAIGSSCHLIHKYGGPFDKYLYESDITGSRSQQYSEYQSAIYYGERDVRCQQTPTPAPEPAQPGVSQDQVNAAISTLKQETTTLIEKAGGTLLNIISSTSDTLAGLIDSAISGLKQELISFIEKNGAMLLTIITSTADTLRLEFSGLMAPIWSGLEEVISKAEEEAAAWRTGVLDLEGRLKAWIEESIISIMLKSLDKEVEEMK